MKEQKLRHVTASDRKLITLATSQNRRYRRWEEARKDGEFGPHCCKGCRKEPCGALWPEAACCHRCSHEPMPRWRLTHVLWYQRKPFYVMEVAARRPGDPTDEERRAMKEAEGRDPSPEERQGLVRSKGVGTVRRDGATDAVYYRWDGVSQWVRRARTHYFLGARVEPTEFLRCLPTEEELRLFAPRDRPPHPLDEPGIAEVDGSEVGEAFRDRVETEPESSPDEETADLPPHVKRGVQYGELTEDEARQMRELGEQDERALRLLGRRP